MTMNRLHLWAAALVLASAASWSSGRTAAADPLQLAIQGRLAAATGSAAPDGNYALAAFFYDQASGGSPIWNESFLAVPVQGGVFALTLGAQLTKLDTALFAAGKPLWVAVQVGGDPELPRQPVLRTPYAVRADLAGVAQDLQCSGCVGSDDLGKAVVTGDKIAQGAVGANHVSFSWAAGDTPGGPATFALGANTAKLADSAKQADAAAFADEAASAKVSDTAKGLQCTGCVGVAQLAAGVPADWAAAGKLAKVAISGKYADLAGGPDLSGYGALAGINTWTGAQTLAAGGALGADLQFNANQALQFRLQNADADPVPCGAKTTGVLYYNTAKNALMVCNGKEYAAFAFAIALGSDAKAPGLSCQQILDKTGSKTNGLYWIDPNGGLTSDAFQAYCDMTTDGGGWTRLEGAKYNFFFGDATWQSYNAGQPEDPNYSIVGQRSYFKVGATYTFRFQTGQVGDWKAGPVYKNSVWSQDHDPFSATTDGSDYKYISGDKSDTCGGFNGLHNKYTTYSYTCDPDSGDGVGCWWMQVVPKQDYNGQGYLDGYGGSGHYHKWQSLWIR